MLRDRPEGQRGKEGKAADDADNADEKHDEKAAVGRQWPGSCAYRLTPTYQHKIGFTRSIFLCRGQQRYARSAFWLGRGEHDANAFLFGTGILF